MKETVIDLIRHGEPVGGARFRGAQDDPLSELGWQQMRSSVGDKQPWSQVISSPLSRCHAFADELSDKLALPLQVNAEFREIHFGAWEGLTSKELMQREPDALQRYWQDPDKHTPEGAERMCDFLERVHSAWDDLVAASLDQHSLLVCHGGVIRAILVRVLGMPAQNLWNFDVPYANVSRIVYHHFPDGGQASQLRFHQSKF